MKWEDATNYRQGEFGKIEPTAWECDVAGVRIWVSSQHRDYRGEWVMRFDNSEPEWIGKGLSDEEAQRIALRKALQKTSANIGKWHGVLAAIITA